MPHLLRVSLKHLPPDGEDVAYPFSIPQIRALPQIDLNVAVTFFVGENGSGKSTLLEKIAAAAELPSIGSSQVAHDDTLGPARQLGSALTACLDAAFPEGRLLARRRTPSAP